MGEAVEPGQETVARRAQLPGDFGIARLVGDHADRAVERDLASVEQFERLAVTGGTDLDSALDGGGVEGVDGPGGIDGGEEGDVEEGFPAAAGIGAGASVIGLYLSYHLGIASGAAIVLVATAAFLLALGISSRVRRPQTGG